MNNQSLVSVLMNCYNSEKYLEETLISLVNQTYLNWQLVFVDNCSTDNSNVIVDKYKRDSRVIYLKTPCHMPLGEAREYGLKWCSGDFICFLDTDDIWRSDKLERQLKFLQNNSEILLCYSSYFLIDEKSQITGRRKFKSRSGDLFGYNLANYEINFQTVMVRRKALELVSRPYFDPSLKFSPDYNLLMHILACGQAACMNEKLVYYRKSSGSLTQKSIALWGKESEYTYHQLDKMGILKNKSTGLQRRQALAKIAYYKAEHCIAEDDYHGARELLREYCCTNYKYLILYLISYFPALWRLAHRFK